MKMICKFCGNSNIEYCDNTLMCEAYDWAWFCRDCDEFLDEVDDIIRVEENDQGSSL